jgi:putative ABC transport system permease protein
MLIRYEGSASDAVKRIEAIWKKRAVNQPFEYTFLDENFDQLFREEQRLEQVFSVMTGIAIFVACLGLLGLASFTAEQRTKEIGIRKVLGASVSSVNTLLSKEFMLLVGISFVLASGIAWYAMNTWLSTFAYRIEMGITVFILSGVMALLIALATVSFHFIKAARSNPTDALKYE